MSSKTYKKIADLTDNIVAGKSTARGDLAALLDKIHRNKASFKGIPRAIVFGGDKSGRTTFSTLLELANKDFTRANNESLLDIINKTTYFNFHVVSIRLIVSFMTNVMDIAPPITNWDESDYEIIEISGLDEKFITDSTDEEKIAYNTMKLIWEPQHLLEQDKINDMLNNMAIVWNNTIFRTWANEYILQNRYNPDGVAFYNFIPLMPNIVKAGGNFQFTSIDQLFWLSELKKGFDETFLFENLDGSQGIDYSPQALQSGHGVVGLYDTASDDHQFIQCDEWDRCDLTQYTSDEIYPEAPRHLFLVINLDAFQENVDGYIPFASIAGDSVSCAVQEGPLFDIPMSIVWTGESALQHRFDNGCEVLQYIAEDCLPEDASESVATVKSAIINMIEGRWAREEKFSSIKQYTIDKFHNLDKSLPVVREIYQTTIHPMYAQWGQRSKELFAAQYMVFQKRREKALRFQQRLLDPDELVSHAEIDAMFAAPYEEEEDEEGEGDEYEEEEGLDDEEEY